MLTPDEYEQLVAAILRQEGWEATVTPPRGDQGLDVIAEKSGVRLGVQVKMYGGSRPINEATVMLTYGAAAFAECTRCMIATNGRVLADTAAVGAKLNVEIRVVPAFAPLVIGFPQRDAEPTASHQLFGSIWSQHVEALTGQTLHRANGRSKRGSSPSTEAAWPEAPRTARSSGSTSKSSAGPSSV